MSFFNSPNPLRSVKASFLRKKARRGMRSLAMKIDRDTREHPERYTDPELAGAIDYISRNGLSIFSFPGCEKYDSVAVDVVDEEELHYVIHNGQRLYFPKMESHENVGCVYRALLREQDAGSPHCYRTDGFALEEGDVLFDIGAAEGIFSLDNIEKASRVFLFETDPKWVGALRKTFEPWKEKVEVINKFVSDTDGKDTVRVDTVIREYEPKGPLFLKLDVEGAEESVLKGAEQALSRGDTKAVVCTYHRHDDCAVLSHKMAEEGYDVKVSKGYMLFIYDMDNMRPPFFRRGVIYCTKTKK